MHSASPDKLGRLAEDADVAFERGQEQMATGELSKFGSNHPPLGKASMTPPTGGSSSSGNIVSENSATASSSFGSARTVYPNDATASKGRATSGKGKSDKRKSESSQGKGKKGKR